MQWCRVILCFWVSNFSWLNVSVTSYSARVPHVVTLYHGPNFSICQLLPCYVSCALHRPQSLTHTKMDRLNARERICDRREEHRDVAITILPDLRVQFEARGEGHLSDKVKSFTAAFLHDLNIHLIEREYECRRRIFLLNKLTGSVVL